MKEINDKILCAYMDGELAAAEAAEFEERLSPQERQQIAQEIQFEAVLSESLKANAGCPDQVWGNVKNMISKEKPQKNILGFPLKTFWKISSIAALFIAGFVLITSVFIKQKNLFSMPDSVADLAKESQVTGTLQEIQQFLDDHNVFFKLPKAKEGGHHDNRLIGAKRSSYKGGQVIELHYSCCKRPLKRCGLPQKSGFGPRVGGWKP